MSIKIFSCNLRKITGNFIAEVVTYFPANGRCSRLESKARKLNADFMGRQSVSPSQHHNLPVHVSLLP